MALLNDEFRHSLLKATPIKNKLILSFAVSQLSPIDQRRLIGKVVNYDAFSESTDPYGERDFGDISHNDETYYFKIDYYDNDLEFESPDPYDPSVTTRVLTIMHQYEY